MLMERIFLLLILFWHRSYTTSRLFLDISVVYSVVSSHLHRLFYQTPNHTKLLINPKPFILSQFSTQIQQNMAKRIAVIGCGISGSVCASTFARNGMYVTMFDQGRGPGGRISQRREMTEDGKELMFDHGAHFFTITDKGVMDLVREWEQRGFSAEWKEKFGSFDCATAKFGEADKNFTCRHGKAYLFNKVVNVNVGVEEDRMMLTGMHTVVDLFCVMCGAIVGWKYEFTHEKAQKYKVRKFILERYRMSGPDENNSRVNLEVAQANVSDADDD